MRYRTVGVICLFLLASALYTWGICPTISWRDTPEFVTIAHTLGIGHPAGSPTYSLFAKLATFLPIGDIALRVNVFSAVAAAAAVALLFLIVMDLFPDASPAVRWGASLSSAVFLMTSESFWSQAEIAEVYTLQNCALLGLLILLLKARSAPLIDQHRYYWLFAFVYGLSAGVHATMALFAPALLCFLGLSNPRVWHPKNMAFLAFFFLCGFAVYLYLPLRSLAEPLFDWGDPETWRQFIYHITDHKDSATHTVVYWHKLPYQIARYTRYLVNELSVFGCLIALVGFLALSRMDTVLWVTTLLLFLGHTAFFIRTWVSPWGFLPSYIIVALWIGCGVYACAYMLAHLYQRYQIRLPRLVCSGVFYGALIFSVLSMAQQHRATASKSHDYSSAHFGKHLLAQLPTNAILFCDYSWFPLLYLQHIERRRPDLTFILQANVFFPHYFPPLSAHRFPNIRQVTRDTPEAMTTLDYFWELVERNTDTHQIFWEPNTHYAPILAQHLIPEGLLFRLQTTSPPHRTLPTPPAHWDQLETALPALLQQPADHEARAFLINKLSMLGWHFQLIDRKEDAARTYHMALRIWPDADKVRNNYGTLLRSQGRLTEARAQFAKAYIQDPIHPTYSKNLGTLLVQMHLDAQAIPVLEQALRLGATGGDVYAQLGVAYARFGMYPRALHALQTALKHYATDPSTPSMNPQKVQRNIDLVHSHIQRITAEMSR
jgi:tetratricopeptide (TPR) repeat protein